MPVEDREAEPCRACRRAPAAARAGRARSRLLAERRREAGAPALEADLALHYGEVVHGNIGTAALVISAPLADRAVQLSAPARTAGMMREAGFPFDLAPVLGVVLVVSARPDEDRSGRANSALSAGPMADRAAGRREAAIAPHDRGA